MAPRLADKAASHQVGKWGGEETAAKIRGWTLESLTLCFIIKKKPRAESEHLDSSSCFLPSFQHLNIWSVLGPVLGSEPWTVTKTHNVALPPPNITVCFTASAAADDGFTHLPKPLILSGSVSPSAKTGINYKLAPNSPLTPKVYN